MKTDSSDKKEKRVDSHYNLSDIEFDKQFSNCVLDPKLFSHEAHLRLGWLNIKNYGLEKGEERIQQQLLNYVEHVGAQDKYNTTVTIVAMRAINHFMKQSKTKSFKDFIAENVRLKTNFKELIAKHYSYDIFITDIGKDKFIEPDVLPFSI
ncbi:hypothetical protein WH52_05890 [Tenacibaculum holothuriorum]|uniref:Uncharacterized protein n=1 Tax=Tenacibaculum holothuriorum TaxID=1635173 RepID=A0A1Y2PF08_9FLAO|nr:hypothetical protein [Tenacibaculum holothuriorum]OSY88299.1 hypothetical protein WH52_05890 [Tenacibaculum holothuriorum]